MSEFVIDAKTAENASLMAFAPEMYRELWEAKSLLLDAEDCDIGFLQTEAERIGELLKRIDSRDIPNKHKSVKSLEAQLSNCKYCGTKPLLFTSEDNGETLYMVQCMEPYCYMRTAVYSDFNELRDYWNNGLDVRRVHDE